MVQGLLRSLVGGQAGTPADLASPATFCPSAFPSARPQGCVVLLGAAAKHLPAGHAKVPSAMAVLLETLDTPSEPVQVRKRSPPFLPRFPLASSVLGWALLLLMATHGPMHLFRYLPILCLPPPPSQESVGACIVPLARALKAGSPALLRSLLDKLLAPGTAYAARRGAAFGLAGCVRGYNLSVLKGQGVMARLEDACVGTAPEGRLGSLMAFECLCRGLGMLFEPYVTRILPLLLRTFGDGNADVREAAQVWTCSSGLWRFHRGETPPSPRVCAPSPVCLPPIAPPCCRRRARPSCPS